MQNKYEDTDLKVQIDKPRERVLVHRFDVGQVWYGEEQDAGMLSHLITKRVQTIYAGW